MPNTFLKLFTVGVAVLLSSTQLNAQMSEKDLSNLFKKEFAPLLKGEKKTFIEKAKEEVRIVSVFMDDIYEESSSGNKLENYLDDHLSVEAIAELKSAQKDQIHEIKTDGNVTAVAYISKPYTRSASNSYGKKKVISSFVLEKVGKEWKLAELAAYPIYGDQAYRENIMKSLSTIYNGSPLQAEAEKVVGWMKSKDVNNILEYPTSRFVFGGETWRGISIVLVEQMDERDFYSQEGYKVPKRYNDMNNKQCLEELLVFLKDDLESGNYKIKTKNTRYNGAGLQQYDDHEYEGFYEGSLDHKVVLEINHILERDGRDILQILSVGFSENSDGPVISYVRQRNSQYYTEEEKAEMSNWEAEAAAEEMVEAMEESMEEAIEGEGYSEEYWEEEMSEEMMPTALITVKTLVDDPYGLILKTFRIGFVKREDNWMINEVENTQFWSYDGLMSDDFGFEGEIAYSFEEGSSEAREEIWEQCIRPILSKDKDRIIQITDFPVFADETDQIHPLETEERSPYISDADEFVDWLNNTLTKEIREIMGDQNHKKISFEYYDEAY